MADKLRTYQCPSVTVADITDCATSPVVILYNVSNLLNSTRNLSSFYRFCGIFSTVNPKVADWAGHVVCELRILKCWCLPSCLGCCSWLVGGPAGPRWDASGRAGCRCWSDPPSPPGSHRAAGCGSSPGRSAAAQTPVEDDGTIVLSTVMIMLKLRKQGTPIWPENPSFWIKDISPEIRKGLITCRVGYAARFFYYWDGSAMLWLGSGSHFPNVTKIFKQFFGEHRLLRRTKKVSVKSSVVDPKWFIPDPDPALNFPSSGSGSRQKFRIHADPDQQHW